MWRLLSFRLFLMVRPQCLLGNWTGAGRGTSGKSDQSTDPGAEN